MKSIRIKYIVCGIIVAAVVVGLFVFSNLSCIAKPEYLKNEPLICSEAKYFAYLAASTDKSKTVPESVSTEGIKSCTAQIRYEYCWIKKTEFLTEKKYDPSKYDMANDLIYNRAAIEFKDCLLNNKP